MAKTFSKLGDLDIATLQQLVASLPEEEWDRFQFRQRVFKVHKETKTIPLLFDTSFNPQIVTPHEHCPMFEKEIQERIKPILTRAFGPGYVSRAILTKLPAGSVIASHIDTGMGLALVHRNHIPIFTNEHCFFTISGKTRVLQAGEVWEINHTGALHEVANRGQADRVHMIVDFYPERRRMV